MDINPRKKKQVIAYRKKKNLCLKCGLDNIENHICLENYYKADMRSYILLADEWYDIVNKYDCPDGVKKATLSAIADRIAEKREEDEKIIETSEKALPEVSARVRTIVSYRKRKNLCLRCGMNPHDGDCEIDYTQSDCRPDNEKEKDPKTISTPKEKSPTIIEKMNQDEINKEFISKHSDDFYKLEQRNKSMCTRDYIIIDLSVSHLNQKIEFSYVNYMSHRYKDKTIYTFGDHRKIFPYHDYLTISKITNIRNVSNVNQQNIADLLFGCKRFFGFPSRLMTFCMAKNIPCTAFFKNSENFDLPCTIVSLEDNENVTVDIVKRNVMAWKI